MTSTSTPLYYQIANQLRENTRAQIYQPGDKLPTEKNLSEHFNVNHHIYYKNLSIHLDQLSK